MFECLKRREPTRPSVDRVGANLPWIPFAKIEQAEMKTRGRYSGGYPRGAVVHFTAGSRPGSLDFGRKMGHAYLMIQEDGTILQAHPLDRWGYHCGESSWPGLGSGLSDQLVGIEIAAAGRLEKVSGGYRSWFGTLIPEDQVRLSVSKQNIQAGAYQKYTLAQEASLTRLLLWLKSNNPDVFKLEYVLGHDEIAPKRKNDPGAALSLTMPEYRSFLASEWAKGTF